jgi:hypothetical protein
VGVCREWRGTHRVSPVIVGWTAWPLSLYIYKQNWPVSYVPRVYSLPSSLNLSILNISDPTGERVGERTREKQGEKKATAREGKRVGPSKST